MCVADHKVCDNQCHDLRLSIFAEHIANFSNKQLRLVAAQINPCTAYKVHLSIATSVFITINFILTLLKCLISADLYGS